MRKLLPAILVSLAVLSSGSSPIFAQGNLQQSTPDKKEICTKKTLEACKHLEFGTVAHDQCVSVLIVNCMNE